MSITKASLIDLNGQELILDADADTSITADTDDQIDIKIAGSDVITLTSSNATITPLTTLTTDGSGFALKIVENSGSEHYQIGTDSFGGLVFYNETTKVLALNDAGGIDTFGNVIFNEDGADLDFRVESSALANMFVVDGGDSRVFIGKNANTSFDAYGSAVMMQLEAAGTSPYAGFGMVQNSNDVDSSVLIFGKSRGTSVASTTIVQDGDTLGRIEFQGMDGGDLETGARIMGSVDGTPGGDDMPGRLTFATTADGANTPTERMRIDSAGQVSFFGTGGNDGYTIPFDQDTTYSNNLNAGAFSILHRNEYDSYIVGNAYYYKTGGTAGWRAKYGSYKSNYISFTNGAIRFYATSSAPGSNGAAISFTEKARIDSDGLKFNSDSAAANALDDYEEGTHATTFAASTSGTVTHGYNTMAYTKVGRLVTCTGYFTISSVSSPVGYLAFSLPFTIPVGNQYSASASVSFNSLSSGVVSEAWPICVNNTNLCRIYTGSTTGASASFAQLVQAGTDVRVTISFMTA